MSLGEYFKMALRNRVSQCGTEIESFSIRQRAANIQKRRESRDSIIFKNRNFTEMALSPIVSPTKSIEKLFQDKPQVTINKKVSKADRRAEMLKKWQADKQKRLAKLKAEKKPVFKVYHVADNPSTTNLDKALKEIKGKPIKAISKGQSSNHLYKVAPSSTYKFKPPVNVKPSHFNKDTTNKHTTESLRQKKKVLDSRKKLNFETETLTKEAGEKSKSLSVTNFNTTTTLGVNSERPVNWLATKGTRYSRRKPSSILRGNLNINSEKENKEPKEVKKHFSSSPSSNDETSGESAVASQSFSNTLKLSNHPSAFESEETNTPRRENESSCSTSYISPYVTVSRGKTNARREYEKKVKGESCDNGSTPRSAAKHFTSVVNTETDRLKSICEKWTNYKDTDDPGEEACDMINVAVGQTELLLNKKFTQFHNLIESCLAGDSEKPITSFDLQGFWDTVLLQVNNLNKRFENLEVLKLNNWEEIIPDVRTRIMLRPVPQKKTKAAPSSGLMAAIKEARKKKQGGNKDEIISITTPSQSQRRRSLRTSVLASESKRKMSSPGLTILKVTPLAKAIESPTAPRSIPKSILKSEKKSIRRKDLKKSVLFSTVDFNEEPKKNNPNAANLLTLSPNTSSACTPRRRSARLLEKNTPKTS